MSTAKVNLWGINIGAVDEDDTTGRIRFNYTDEIIGMGVQLSPITMPLSRVIYEFPALRESSSFRGLPGLLSDSLPDKFGNRIIDMHLAQRGIDASGYGAVPRLLYMGRRAMGALEYEPATEDLVGNYENSLDLKELVQLSADILANRESVHFTDKDLSMQQMISVGTSAGGARAKALIALNRETGDIRSGQATPKPGYEHYLIKFDGIDSNKDVGDAEPDPKCSTRIEYAYYLMATDAGINMNSSELFKENGFYHFMTKRFDRTDDGKKIHMQTLGAMAHYDLTDNAGTNSYEQAIMIMQKLGLDQSVLEQFFRRAVFNICGKNHDDHVKNTSFLMNRQGEWSLSPAYDITFSYKPGGRFTNTHHLSLNNKIDNHDVDDLLAFAAGANISQRKARNIIREVVNSVENWISFAEKADVPEELAYEIKDKQILFTL